MTSKKLPHKQLLLLAAILALSLILVTSNILLPLTARTPTEYSSTILHAPLVQAGSYDMNVTMIDLSFAPQRICIEKGDMVNWTNNDPVIHTLWFTFAENQSTYLLSDPIPPGQTWSHTFTEPFKTVYYSFKRLWITGKVSILPVMGDFTGPENPPGSGQYPPDLVVDIYDLAAVGKAYGSTPGSPTWNEDADMTGPENPPASGQYPPDNIVDIYDLALVGKNYGKIDP